MTFGPRGNLSTAVIMPALGVAQEAGTLLKWLKSEGETVARGEPLMEIETDKATVEIEAPASGVLAGVVASPGDRIPVGNRIALILAPGEGAGASSSSPPVEEKSTAPPASGGTSPGAASRLCRVGVEGPLAPSGDDTRRPPRSGPRRPLASPAAKRIARENDIDLASITGSGPEGSIRSREVLAAAQARADVRTPHQETIRPLSAMRRIVAERMALSKQTAPHFYLSVDIDMSAVIRWRADRQSGDAARKPSHNDFVLYACARALKKFPSLNGSYTDQGIRLYGAINIGVAVALDDGLVVPVIRNADGLSIEELAAASRSVIAKARNKKLLPLDCEQGTFTVSNLGMFGIDKFVAIIHPGQAAILAVGRIEERVVALSGMFAIRPMMTVTLSADHRAVDGATGARFLQRIKADLEKAEFPV